MKKRMLSGQSLVEFALIFPMVLLLLLGFLDLGRAVFYYSSLSNAVREGTRKAIVNHGYLVEAADGTDMSKLPCSSTAPANPIDDTLRCIVYRYSFGLASDFDPAANIVFAFSKDAEDEDLFNTVQITADYCFDPITPGIELVLSSECDGEKGILLTAQSKMYVAPVAR
jgi:hypothetical protein